MVNGKLTENEFNPDFLKSIKNASNASIALADGSTSDVQTQINNLIKDDDLYVVPDSTVANTYTATITKYSKLTAPFKGLGLYLEINVASTGSSTLNINNWGAFPILDSLQNPITNNGLRKGVPYHLKFNGTAFTVLGKGGGGNATASQLLSGATATVDTGMITGTIPSKSGQTYIVNTVDQTISANQYLSGDQIVKGYPDLQPQNIVLNKQIGNVFGSAVTITNDSVFLGIPYRNIGDSIVQVISISGENDFYYSKVIAVGTYGALTYQIMKYNFATNTISSTSYTTTTHIVYHEVGNYLIINGIIFDKNMNFIYDTGCGTNLQVDTATQRVFRGGPTGNTVTINRIQYIEMQLDELNLNTMTWSTKWKNSVVYAVNYNGSIFIINNNYILLYNNEGYYQKMNVDTGVLSGAYNWSDIGNPYPRTFYNLKYCGFMGSQNTITGHQTFNVCTVDAMVGSTTWDCARTGLYLTTNLGPSYYRQDILGGHKNLIFLNSDGTFGRYFSSYGFSDEYSEEWVGFSKNFIIATSGNLYKYR